MGLTVRRRASSICPFVVGETPLQWYSNSSQLRYWFHKGEAQGVTYPRWLKTNASVLSKSRGLHVTEGSKVNQKSLVLGRSPRRKLNGSTGAGEAYAGPPLTSFGQKITDNFFFRILGFDSQ
eukprot:TRINITY_DN577_c0_g2_i10.p3 TRINITY_DN577_c0_g2~~TRINITY_DN577_c0_g2_i10.p3  ORF type:complete len:122 (+),score=8.45 TRINITY_DN577_c0_g2_i10:248-613(+)